MLETWKFAGPCKSVVTEDGIELSYMEVGEENEEIVISGAFYFHTWAPVIEELGRHFHVYGVVMRFGDGQGTMFNEDGSIHWAKQWAVFSARTRAINTRLFLYDLMEENIADRLLIRMRLNQIRKIYDGTFVTAAIRAWDSQEHVQFSAAAQDSIRSYFDDCLSMVYRESIVLLIHTPKGHRLTYQSRNLESYLRYNRLVSGFSNSFTDLTQIRRFWTQAEYAISSGLITKPDQCSYRYNDYYFSHMLSVAANSLNLRDLCHPLIKELNDSGDANDREMLKTLYVYVKTQRDMNKAAEILHVHRNTLYYRIGLINKRLDGKLNDFEEFYHIAFSFKLIEYYNIFLPDENKWDVVDLGEVEEEYRNKKREQG